MPPRIQQDDDFLSGFLQGIAGALPGIQQNKQRQSQNELAQRRFEQQLLQNEAKQKQQRITNKLNLMKQIGAAEDPEFINSLKSLIDDDSVSSAANAQIESLLAADKAFDAPLQVPGSVQAPQPKLPTKRPVTGVTPGTPATPVSSQVTGTRTATRPFTQPVGAIAGTRDPSEILTPITSPQVTPAQAPSSDSQPAQPAPERGFSEQALNTLENFDALVADELRPPVEETRTRTRGGVAIQKKLSTKKSEAQQRSKIFNLIAKATDRKPGSITTDLARQFFDVTGKKVPDTIDALFKAEDEREQAQLEKETKQTEREVFKEAFKLRKEASRSGAKISQEQAIKEAAFKLAGQGKALPESIQAQLFEDSPNTNRILSAPEKKTLGFPKNAVVQENEQTLDLTVLIDGKPVTAPATKNIQGTDGKPHVMAFNPESGKFDVDQGIAASPGMNINLGGLTKATQSDLESQIVAGADQLVGLNELLETFDESFLTLGGAATSGAQELLDKAGAGGLVGTEFLEKRSAYVALAQAEKLKFRKSITGVAGGEKEFNEIVQAFPNPISDSPAKFKSKLEQTIKNRKNLIKRLILLKGAGITKPTEEDFAKIPLNSPLLDIIPDDQITITKEQRAALVLDQAPQVNELLDQLGIP